MMHQTVKAVLLKGNFTEQMCILLKLGENFSMIPFPAITYRISEKIKLTVIDIEKTDKKLKSVLDNNFVLICEGNSGSDLATAKKHVSDLYASKNKAWIMGATAEFFVHLYIRLSGFKQECLFLNMEENSIKKGFDGYYSYNGDEWIMESKAGSAETEGNSHANKVKLAADDLEAKVAGTGKTNKKKPNNPWRNAYLHASQLDVGSDEQIRKNLKALSDDYIKGIYHSIEEFNTMPCGTLFLSGAWNPPTHDEVLDDIRRISSKLKGRQIHVICITQKSVDIFCTYIKQED